MKQIYDELNEKAASVELVELNCVVVLLCCVVVLLCCCVVVLLCCCVVVLCCCVGVIHTFIPVDLQPGEKSSSLRIQKALQRPSRLVESGRQPCLSGAFICLFLTLSSSCFVIDICFCKFQNQFKSNVIDSKCDDMLW